MTLEKLRCVFQLAVRRYLDDIEHAHERGLHFDAEIAEKSLQFVETVCTHQKAEWAGQPFLLSPNQQFILWNLTGWRRENGCRRFRRANNSSHIPASLLAMCVGVTHFSQCL